MAKYRSIPLNDRVLFKKDKDQGNIGLILLPEDNKIPRYSGRIIAISEKVKNDMDYKDLQELDKVLIDPSRAFPVDCKPDNDTYVVPVKDIILKYETVDEDEK